MTITGRSFLLATLLANSVVAQNLRPRQLQTNTLKAPEGVDARHPASVDGVPGTPTKSPSSGVHKPTWKPSSKPVEGKSVQYSQDPKGNTVSKVVRPAHAEGEKDLRSENVRNLAGQVIKDDADPCHDGLSPRCTPPTSKPVEHASKQAAALPRTLAAVPVTKDDADPCHDGLSPRCTPPTSKPVEHRSLSGKTDKPSEKKKTNKPAEKATKQGAALPRSLSAVPVTKDKDGADPCHDGLSPRCTPPTSKPVEHRVLQTAGPKKLIPAEGVVAKHPEVIVPVAPVTKDDTDPCHDGISPRCTPPTSKPVERVVATSKVVTSSTQIHDGPKTVRPSHMEGEVDTGRGEPTVHRALSGFKAGSPTKSPSTGIMKPTWKPSSKPNERKLTIRGKGKTEKPIEGPPAPQPRAPRELSAVPVTKDDADPCHDGLSPRCTPPTSKPVEHASKQASALPRTLQAVHVTKDDTDPCHDGLSPRCTPPTSKPVEHASKQAAALPRTLAAVPVTKDDADPCHDGLSPRCTPPTSKPVEHNVKRSLAGSPTKSPSSGLHKPTWSPSSKPVENSVAEVVTSSSSSASSSSSSSSTRESGPKGAAKKLAHDGAPSSTTTTSTSRKLSSKSSKTGKDPRPTMTPRTDKPSDREA